MIIGKEIYLRPIVKEDIAYLNEWKNNKDTYKYLGGGFMPVSIDQQVSWMDSMIDLTGNNKRYIICTKNDIPVGMVGLYSINWIHRTCEIGIYLGNKEFRGNNYGEQACILIEKFAKEYLNLRKIKLEAVSRNNKAIEMWKRLGYKKIGEYIDERFIEGQYESLTIMDKFI